MILLLTTESGDASHIEIVNWLEYINANYMVLTGESLLRGETEFSYINNEIFCNGINLTKEVTVVYYRRWIYPSSLVILEDKVLNEAIVNNLFREMLEIRKMLEFSLCNALWIPKGQSISVNKLRVLELAEKAGLIIPKTIVTNNKKEILKFADGLENGIITKAIGNYEPMHSSSGERLSPIHTKEVDIAIVKNSSTELFVLSLFQEKILKIFELRVFFFLGTFHTVAVLSQLQAETSIDSRIANETQGSKLSPYQLPEKIKSKLISLFETLDLNIGSVDFILTPDNKYIFLEVNPVGQIGGYSRRTGYNIEKQIATKIVEIDEKNKFDRKI